MTARLLRQLVLGIALASTSLAGCAAQTDDEESAAADALSLRELKVSECKVAAVNRSQTPGVFDAALSGCLVARGTETGAAMIERAVAIIGDANEIGGATHPNGSKMFSSFKPAAAQGSLANGGSLTYDAKIGLDIKGPFDAKGTLRFSAQRTAAGGVTLTITNTTGIGALGIKPVEAGGLVFVLTLSPAQNGVVVTGSVNVTLVSQKDQVGAVSSVAPEIVGWLKGKLGAQ